MMLGSINESRRKLYESRDFVELARLGHELIEGPPAGIAAESDTLVEASFRCKFCGDEARFRNLAWGLVAHPLWVLSDISGGDPNEDCQARRARRLGQRRIIQSKVLDRWKRLRWTATHRGHFN